MEGRQLLGQILFEESVEVEQAIPHFQYVVEQGRGNNRYDRGLYLAWSWFKLSSTVKMENYDKALQYFTDLQTTVSINSSRPASSPTCGRRA